MVVLAGLSYLSRSAHADGAALSEIGNSLVGRAAAGWAASAEDASTVLMNPAGMSRLDRSQRCLAALGINCLRQPHSN
ncbi:hypothetical protein BVY02_01350 [bacterium J17]|nr:hypothetical protein BVY02_01350 [bacterium J17]